MNKEQKMLLDIYDKLYNHFGYRNWWPGETKWEVIVGAILTQNVAWRNVEQAIANLKEADLFELEAIYHGPLEKIASLIRPSRYYNTKARKLKSFANHIMKGYAGNLNSFLVKPLSELRQELLQIWGIGPETADCILLYCAELPSFVVDAYTKRIFTRIGIFNEEVTYHGMRNYFMDNLKGYHHLFNDYHAQIVALGHNICKNIPLCNKCPLQVNYCQYQRIEKSAN